MPRTDVPITQIADSGVAPPSQVTGDTVNGHELASNTGDVFIEAQNTDSGGAHAVTVITPGQVAGEDITDRVVSVAASAISLIGPFPPQVFNQPTGKVNLSVADTKVKLRAYRL